MAAKSGKLHVSTHSLFRAFKHFDTNNSGALDTDELAAILSNQSGNRPCSPEEARRMAQEVIAKYSNGQESVLHFQEFIHYWSERDKQIADKLLAKALRAEADAEAKAATVLAEAAAEERELGEAGKAIMDLEILEARMGTLQAAFDKEVREPGPDAASKGTGRPAASNVAVSLCVLHISVHHSPTGSNLAASLRVPHVSVHQRYD